MEEGFLRVMQQIFTRCKQLIRDSVEQQESEFYRPEPVVEHLCRIDSADFTLLLRMTAEGRELFSVWRYWQC